MYVDDAVLVGLIGMLVPIMALITLVMFAVGLIRSLREIGAAQRSIAKSQEQLVEILSKQSQSRDRDNPL